MRVQGDAFLWVQQHLTRHDPKLLRCVCEACGYDTYLRYERASGGVRALCRDCGSSFLIRRQLDHYGPRRKYLPEEAYDLYPRLNLAQIAEACQLSQSTVRRCFRERGITVSRGRPLAIAHNHKLREVNAQRSARIRARVFDLWEQGYGLGEIRERIGYASAASVHVHVRKHPSYSPAESRRRGLAWKRAKSALSGNGSALQGNENQRNLADLPRAS